MLWVLVERLAAAMHEQVARVWLLTLGYDNFAILVTLDLAEARESDQRIGTQLLEIWRSVEQNQFVHEFDPHFCENCANEVCFGKAETVHIVGGGLQVLPVP